MTENTPINDNMIIQGILPDQHHINHHVVSKKEIILTPSHSEVMHLLIRGFGYKQIGVDLGINENSVKKKVSEIFKYYNVNSAIGLMLHVVNDGLVDTSSLVQPDFDSSVFEKLPPRQLEITDLIAQDFSYKEISHRLGISVQTVKNQVQNIYLNTGLDRRVGLAVGYLEARGKTRVSEVGQIYPEREINETIIFLGN